MKLLPQSWRSSRSPEPLSPELEGQRVRVLRLLSELPDHSVRASGHAWVTIMNPDGVQVGKRAYPFGERFAIKFGGWLTEVTRDPATSEVLVRYKASETPYAIEAPTDALFFLPGDVFDGMQQAYERRVAEILAERRLTRELLKAAVGGRTVVAPERWFNILDLNLIDYETVVHDYYDHRIAEIGGRLKEVGRQDGRVLVRYTAPGPTTGTSMPSGALSYLIASEFDALESWSE